MSKLNIFIDSICSDWASFPDFEGKLSSNVFIKMVLSWLGDKNEETKDELIKIFLSSIYITDERLAYEEMLLGYVYSLKPKIIDSQVESPDGNVDWAKTYLLKITGVNKFVVTDNSHYGELSKVLLYFVSEALDDLNEYLRSYSELDLNNLNLFIKRKNKMEAAYKKLIFLTNGYGVSVNKISPPYLLRVGIKSQDIKFFIDKINPFVYGEIIKNFYTDRYLFSDDIFKVNEDYMFEGAVFMRTVLSICNSLQRKSIPFLLSFCNLERLFKIEFKDFMVRIGKKRPDIMLASFTSKEFSMLYKDSSLEVVNKYISKASGLEPDVVICRASIDSDGKIKPKFCFVDAKNYNELSSKVIRDQFLYNYLYRLDINGFNWSPGSILVFPTKEVFNKGENISFNSKDPVKIFSIDQLSPDNEIFDFLIDDYS